MARKVTAIEKRRALAAERRAKVVALRDKFNLWAENADPAFVAAIIARLSDYSPRNAQLIAMQSPDATEVHGYQDWKNFGRQVKRGETGIQILAPAGTYEVEDKDQAPIKVAGEDESEDKETRMRFRVAYVFDIAQTEPVSAPATQEGTELVA